MRRRAGTLIVAGLALLASVAVVTVALAATPPQVTSADRAAAVDTSERILGAVVLPAGTTQVAREPTGGGYVLGHREYVFLDAAQIDRHRFWTTSAFPANVEQTVAAHLPRGSRPDGTVGPGSSGELVDEYILPVTDHRQLGARQLIVTADPLPDGATAVRVDVELVYRAPRLASQRVPPAAAVLDIARTGGTSRGAIHRTTRNRAVVGAMAQLLNRLPFEGRFPFAAGCPAESADPSIVTFTFRARSSGPALAELTEDADTPSSEDICAYVRLRVRGRPEPTPLDGGLMLRRADALLGLHLASN